MPRTSVADVSTVLTLQLRAEARQAAGGNRFVSRQEQTLATPFVRAAAEEVRATRGPGARVSVDAVEEVGVRRALALIGSVNQADGPGAALLSRAEALAAFRADRRVGEAVLRAYEVASGNGLDVDALAAVHVNADISSDAVFRVFDDEADAMRAVDPSGLHIWWLVAERDSLLSKSFVAGRDDTWTQRFDVDRLTGAITVTAEH